MDLELTPIFFFSLPFFSFPGITAFDLSATVTSPGGVTEDAVINEVEDGLYAVHFVPKELGVHTVSVKYKEIHIPGNHDFQIYSFSFRPLPVLPEIPTDEGFPQLSILVAENPFPRATRDYAEIQ